ncbi:MAG: hypothetical protein VZQ62_00760 [Methanosphaera sp.]|nr:hypothetical protein [Methanosphaera sp.]
MTFFTSEEFEEKYSDYSLSNEDYQEWQIEAVSEMIFSQIGLSFRDSSWDDTNVPSAIKNASMEQLRFMIEHSIPFIDYNKKVEAGDMKADILSDYSTLALRMLSNAGYMYRGNPINANMVVEAPFGD